MTITPLLVLQAAVVVITVVFTVVLVLNLIKTKEELKGRDKWVNLGICGVATQFIDALGIGSYGPMTAWWKITKAMPDKQIPGTLNICAVVACSFTTLAYTTVIEVEIVTLVTLIASATLGAVLGAGIVSKLNVTVIRYGMGIALIVVVLVMLAGIFKLMPVGGEAIGLSTGKLIISALICFALGSLMTIGVGCYAPMMALVFAMGLSPAVAFPVMMGSCAFLMPAAGMRFIKANTKEKPTYSKKASIMVNIGGCVGVAVAVLIVKSIPLTALKWLVCAVLIYTSIMLLRDAVKGKKTTLGSKAEA
ncbi:MAG: sulfite exporter TauE/SafE family protein [Coriobacteriales bacterium]|nr:sulfite exporter TauE/SafE family protein [Coriobacteriales bacterium]